MSIKRTLVKNTSYNLAGYGYLLVASFISVPILLHALGSSLFGVYMLAAGIPVVTSVLDLGLGPAVVRRLALPERSPCEENRTWGTSLTLFLALGVVVGVASSLVWMFGLLPRLSETISGTEGIFLAAILGITVMVNLVNTHFLALPQARFRFDIYNLKTFVVGTANTLGAAAIAIIVPGSLVPIFFVQLMAHLVTLTLLYSYARRTLGGSLSPRYDHREGRELLSFGGKNFGGVVASQLEAQISRYILGLYLTPGAVTYATIPENLVYKAAGGVNQLATAFFPVSTALTHPDRLPKLRRLLVYLELGIVACGLLGTAAAVMWGQPVLAWWLHDPAVARAAYPVLVILCAYAVFLAAAPLPTMVLNSLNRPEIPTYFALLTLATEVGAMVYLTPRFGYVGPALASLGTGILTVPPYVAYTFVILNKKLKAK